MDLDILLDVGNLHVENEITDVDLEGGCRIYGAFFKPLFQGEMRLLNGKVFVLNNEFDLERGRISLDRLVPSFSILDLIHDPLLLNPELDLSAVTIVIPIDAETDEEQYEVTFVLEGPLQQVTPRFQSDPALEDRELLRLIAFGSKNDFSVLFEEENRTALYSVAGQLLLSRQVKKIGLDEFMLLPSGTILETVGQPAIHFGKHFSWPLAFWVRYEGATHDLSLGEIRLEHRIRSFLTITGTSQSEKERYGVGVGIEKEF